MVIRIARAFARAISESVLVAGGGMPTFCREGLVGGRVLNPGPYGPES